MHKEKKRRRIGIVVQVIAMLYWLLFQEGCDTYYIPYLLIGILGSVACCDNCRMNRGFQKNGESRIIVFSSL